MFLLQKVNIHTKKVNIFIFVFVSGACTLEILEKLNMEDDIISISKNHAAAKNRMIFTKDHGICLLPSSFSGMLIKHSPFSKSLARIILGDIFAKQLEIEEDTIYNFCQRRFGKEFANFLIAPLICGICAGDAREISVNFMLKSLFEMEQKHGGIIKGYLSSVFEKKTKTISTESKLSIKAKRDKWAFYTFKNGLEMFPMKLKENLEQSNVDIKKNVLCKQINFECNQAEIVTSDGKICTQKLVSTLPAYELGKSVQIQHPMLAAELAKITYVNVVVVNLLYDESNLIKKPGFGVLVPPIENLPVLGITFDSECLNLLGKTLITVMMGGKWFYNYFDEDTKQSEILTMTKKHVAIILKIKKEPINYQISVLKNCIPQYKVGHEKIIQNVEKYIKKNNLPLTICGNFLNGVGINDTILSTKTQICKSFS